MRKDADLKAKLLTAEEEKKEQKISKSITKIFGSSGTHNSLSRVV